MSHRNQTLGEFIIENQSSFKYTSGELSRLINSIRLAAKVVNYEVNKAGLVDIIGNAGDTNIQGEDQQKLDVYANDTFIKTMTKRNIVCGIASEEEDDFIAINSQDENHQNKYVVLIDPLDGSSNIDVNISVGTIFSVLKRKNPNQNVSKEEFYVAGKEQVAAGYVIYGSSTMLVYTTGNGVNGFTLDPSIGEFYLSHPNMTTPKNGEIFSINEANEKIMPLGVQKYAKFCHELDSNGDRTHTARFMGSLVADFHRNLLKGGIYIYPNTNAAKQGRLRLMYECSPLAWIIEEAGGKASDGKTRILDIVPNDIHQRVPLFIGSTEMMNKAEKFMAES